MLPMEVRLQHNCDVNVGRTRRRAKYHKLHSEDKNTITICMVKNKKTNDNTHTKSLWGKPGEPKTCARGQLNAKLRAKPTGFELLSTMQFRLIKLNQPAFIANVERPYLYITHHAKQNIFGICK